MGKITKVNIFEDVLGNYQDKNLDKSRPSDTYSTQIDQNSQVLLDYSCETSKMKENEDHYHKYLNQFYDFESTYDPNQQKQLKRILTIEDLKQNLSKFSVNEQQQQIDETINTNSINNRNYSNNSSNNNSNWINCKQDNILKDGDNLVRNIYKIIKKGKGKKYTYKNETKNIPSLFGNILLKLLKRKITDNQQLNKIKQISTLKDLKQLFLLSKNIQNLCFYHLSSGGVVNLVANSLKIKSKKCVIKYIDRLIIGCMDPDNFEALILK